MSLRKKVGPAPISRASAPRSLAAATTRSALPTAAALALALAGCAIPVQDGVSPDPITRTGAKIQVSAPSTSASIAPIEPTPHALPGEAPMVIPAPPPSASVAPCPIPPSGAHKTAGKPSIVKPTI